MTSPIKPSANQTDQSLLAPPLTHPPAIVAVATPKQVGAIAMIRLSGHACFQLIEPCLHFKAPLSFAEACMHPRQIFRCAIMDQQASEVVDDGTIIIYQAPRSYTGENAVELLVHGGLYIVERIMALLLRAGFQQAAPGEFTQRAFLNGKLDLVQAEGVRELTAATSHSQWQVARSLSDGHLTECIAGLRAQIMATLALMEAAFDFPEEADTASILNQQTLAAGINELAGQLEQLDRSYRSGHVARRGLQVVLCGRANAGKSSLMNALCQAERAIVTSEPGTTRDYLEETLLIEGLQIVVTDTAGLRELAADQQLPRGEVLAIHTSLERACAADLIVHVQPSTDPVPLDLHAELTRHLHHAHPKGSHDLPQMVRVRSFADQPAELSWHQATDIPVAMPPGGDVLGVDAVQQCLQQHAQRWVGEIRGTAFICTQRQKRAVEEASTWVRQAATHLKEQVDLVVIAQDLHQAAGALTSIIGEVSPDQVMDEIFAQFCIGK